MTGGKSRHLSLFACQAWILPFLDRARTVGKPEAIGGWQEIPISLTIPVSQICAGVLGADPAICNSLSIRICS